MDSAELQAYLASATVAPEVFALRPDYRALLIVVDGITPRPSDAASEALLQDAETMARTTLAKTPVAEIPHVAAWRDAYKAFGSKPQKFRNSLEALTRRADGGLPRVNRLTDVYNAVSVKYQIPLGGEDLSKYVGPPRCVRASGKEDFETTASGQTVVEHPDVGEVVWCDDKGVTCRRWNWRQGPRTALSDGTKSVLFICDALQPFTDEELSKVGEELVNALKQADPGVKVAQRLISKADD